MRTTSEPAKFSPCSMNEAMVPGARVLPPPMYAIFKRVKRVPYFIVNGRARSISHIATRRELKCAGAGHANGGGLEMDCAEIDAREWPQPECLPEMLVRAVITLDQRRDPGRDRRPD